MHYSELRTIHLDAYRLARGYNGQRLSMSHRSKACRVHAAAIQVLAQHGVNPADIHTTQNRKIFERQFHCEVRKKFGPIAALFLQIIIGVIVKIIVQWIYDQFFKTGTFRSSTEMREAFVKWNREAENTPD